MGRNDVCFESWDMAWPASLINEYYHDEWESLMG